MVPCDAASTGLHAARRFSASTSCSLLAAILILLCGALAPAASAAQFKVAAVGDSFTEGWDPQTRRKTPYADSLRYCLQNAVNWRADIVVDNFGVGWASVFKNSANVNLTQMVINFANTAKSQRRKYDFVILWIVGINDLVNSRQYMNQQKPFPFSDLLKKYRFLWDTLKRDAALRVLIMPQPSFAFDKPNGVWEQRRKKMASIVKTAVKDANTWQLKYLDIVASGFDAHRMSASQRKAIYSGGIHLSQKGYQDVGKLVCRFLTGWAKQAAGISNKRKRTSKPKGRKKA